MSKKTINNLEAISEDMLTNNPQQFHYKHRRNIPNSGIRSNRAFKYPIIALFLTINLFIFSSIINKLQLFFDYNLVIKDTIIGLFTVGTGIIALIGIIQSIKGIKEPNTLKKIIAFTINLVIIGFFSFGLSLFIFKAVMLFTNTT